MITQSKQSWQVGNKVNVGFLRDLLVVAKVPTPNDCMPDVYLLMNAKRVLYQFMPHKGLSKLTEGQAMDLMNVASEKLNVN